MIFGFRLKKKMLDKHNISIILKDTDSETHIPSNFSIVLDMKTADKDKLILYLLECYTTQMIAERDERNLILHRY